MVKNLPIGSRRYFGTGFQGKSSNHPFILPISSHIHIIVSGCIGYNWNVIGNIVSHQTFYSSNSNNISPLFYLTHRASNLVIANRCIGKEQKRSIIRYRCPRSSQAPPKRNAPKSTKTKPKRQKNTTIFPASSSTSDPSNTFFSTSINAPDASRPGRCV